MGGDGELDLCEGSEAVWKDPLRWWGEGRESRWLWLPVNPTAARALTSTILITASFEPWDYICAVGTPTFRASMYNCLSFSASIREA